MMEYFMCLTSSTEQKLNQQTMLFLYITWDFDEYTNTYVIVFFLDS